MANKYKEKLEELQRQCSDQEYKIAGMLDQIRYCHTKIDHYMKVADEWKLKYSNLLKDYIELQERCAGLKVQNND